MRKSLMVTTVLAAFLAGGAAMADVATGEIQSVDVGTHTVTLADGNVYTMSNDQGQRDILGGFQPGDVVTLVWTQQGNTRSAESISSDFSGAIEGTVTAVDPGAHTVTLDNGTTYSFKNHGHDQIDLAGFKAGDQVLIVTSEQGDATEAHAISGVTFNDTTGRIAAVNDQTKTVELEGGQVYLFHHRTDSVDLSGFRVGDTVTINSATLQDVNWGRSIAAVN